MKKLRDKRLIIFITLIATILSVLLSLSVLTDADSSGGISILDYAGTVEYLPNEKLIVASSHMVGEAVGGIYSWEDVQNNLYLLCNQKDGKITGRETSEGKIDHRMYDEGKAPQGIFDFQDYSFLANDIEHFLQLKDTGDFSTFNLSGETIQLENNDDWVKVFGTRLDYIHPGEHRIFYTNSGTLYKVTGTVAATPAEAYILAEMNGAEGDVGVTVTPYIDSEGNYEYLDGDTNFVYTEETTVQETMTYEPGTKKATIGYKTKTSYGFGNDGALYQLSGSGEVVGQVMTTKEVDDAGGKAGFSIKNSGKLDVSGISEDVVIEGEPITNYGDPYMQDENGRWVKAKVFRKGFNLQQAWWSIYHYTPGTVSSTVNIEVSNIVEEARLFAQYRKRVQQNDYVEISEGDYSPKWMLNDDFKDNTGTYNLRDIKAYIDQEEGSIVVGPYAIDFIEAYTKLNMQSTRPPVMFAGICDYKIYLKGSEESLQLGDDFEFIWTNGERYDYEYPHEKEVYYIKFKTFDDISALNNIDRMEVKFKYMDAKGSYTTMEGQFAQISIEVIDRSNMLSDLSNSWNNKLEENYEEIKKWVLEHAAVFGVTGFPHQIHSEIAGNLGPVITLDDIIKSTTRTTHVYNGKQYGDLDSFLDDYDGDDGDAKWNEIAETKTYYYVTTLYSSRADYNQRLNLRVGIAYGGSYNLIDAQPLCWGVEGTKWYNYCILKREMGIPNTAEIVVEKHIEDSEGTNLDSIYRDQVYQVEVSVSGAKNSEDFPAILDVRPGESVSAPLVYWEEGAAPTYEVKEILEEGQPQPTIINGSGTLSDDNKVAIAQVINYVPVPERKTTLRIEKEIEESLLGEEGNEAYEKTRLGNQKFEFKAYITGTFKYKGELYINETLEINDIIISKDTNWEWTSEEDVIWYDETPTFTAEEIKIIDGKRVTKKIDGTTAEIIDEYKEESLLDEEAVPGTAYEVEYVTPSSVKLIQDGDTVIRLINEETSPKILEHAKLKIIKRIDDDSINAIKDFYGDEEGEKIIMGKKFSFKVTVDKGNEKIITNVSDLQAEKRLDKKENKVYYEWIWESNDYYWTYGNNPAFTIEELETENTELIDIQPQENPKKTEKQKIMDFASNINNKKASGILTMEKPVDYNQEDFDYTIGVVFTNKVNTPPPPDLQETESGGIKITKVVSDDKWYDVNKDKYNTSDDNYWSLVRPLHDRGFQVKLVIRGSFYYDLDGDGKYSDNEIFKEAEVKVIPNESGGIEFLDLNTNMLYTAGGEPQKLNDIELQEKEDQYIIINIPEYPTNGSTPKETESWQLPGKLEWIKGKDVPEFEVDEILQGETNISKTIQIGTLHQELDGKNEGRFIANNTADVTITNIMEDEEHKYKIGYLRVIKTLENPELFSQSYKEGLSFEFELTVKGTESAKKQKEIYGEEVEKINILLDYKNYNKETGEWTWNSDEFMWDEKLDNPTYEIKELHAYFGKGAEKEEIPGFTLKGADSDNKVYGTLIECDGYRRDKNGILIDEEGNPISEEDLANGKKSKVPAKEIIPKEVGLVNIIIPIPYKAKIHINKEITDKILEKEEFEFKLDIKGVTSDGEKVSFQYHEYEETSPWYSELTINPNGTVSAKKADTGEVVSFSVTAPKITGNGTWDSEEIKWQGKQEKGPSYELKEIIKTKDDEGNTINPKYETFETQNNSGSLKHNDEITVRVVNEPTDENPDYKYGQLKVTKRVIKGGENRADKDYLIEIQIGNEEPYRITLKKDGIFRSRVYKWKKDEQAPSYSIREIVEDDDNFTVSYTNESGMLDERKTEEDAIESPTEAEVKNTYPPPPHYGQVKVEKNVVVDDLYKDYTYDTGFEIRVTFTGKEFEVAGQKVDGRGGSITETITLRRDESKTYNVKWEGETPPTVTVDELNKNDLPGGIALGEDLTGCWHFGNISNNGAQVPKESTTTIIVTNIFTIPPPPPTNISLAGDVWEEQVVIDEKGTENTVINGIFDGKDNLLDNIEVYVYESGGGLAEIYHRNSTTETISQPLLTKGGHWEAPNLKWKAGTTYYVEFVYDGQKYKSTKYLVTGEGSAGSYIGASTSDRDKFANDSMAKETKEDREKLNGKLETIKGYLPRDASGNTIGKAEGSSGEILLNYTSSDILDGNANRASSRLVTTDENGNVKEEFKMKVKTQGELEYPFDNRVVIGNSDKVLDGKEYRATYEYCHHINLGLVKKPSADMGATKVLKSAKVSFMGEEQEITGVKEMKFNTLADKEALTAYERQLIKDPVTHEFELGLYKSNYFYRAEVYQTDGKIYDAFMKKYTGIETIQDLELKVELKYKIQITNDSLLYNTVIKSFNDYPDAELGEPIKVEGIEGYTIKDNGTIIGSDGVKYRKLTFDLGQGVSLEKGQSLEVELTFEVEKRDAHEAHNAILTGKKVNIVEVASYSVYKDGELAGVVDGDSAPDNINIREYNNIDYYEDDTDSSPILKLFIKDDRKEVSGVAWEDSKKNKSSNGDGKRKDAKEARIAGLTTQIVEILRLPDENGVERDYEFLWPTYTRLSTIGAKTLEEITGFDSTTETATKATIDKAVIDNADDLSKVPQAGEYMFNSVPTGKFIVRYLYGNDKTELEDKFGITGKAYASKLSGEYWNDETEVRDKSGNIILDENGNPEKHRIYVANYDKEDYGYTPAVYNGQDFKATLYSGSLTDKYIDLDAIKKEEVSDGIDNEVRRMELITKAETIKNRMATLLAKANNDDAIHKELYSEYYMFADTPIMELINENNEFAEANIKTEVTTSEIGNSAGASVTEEKTKYTIENVDIGLIERPETSIVLDKQISNIKIVTNDKKTIFDASYKISYEEFDINMDPLNLMTSEDRLKELKQKTIVAELEDGKYLIAKVELDSNSIGTDVLQAVNKFERKLDKETADGQFTEYEDRRNGTKFFRFINTDDTIIQGATVELSYKYTALNVGELDYLGEDLAKAQETVINNLDKKARGEAIQDTDSITIKSELLKIIKQKRKEQEEKMLADAVENGKYLGEFYYLGKEPENKKGQMVKTRVRQLIDYVDNDISFDASDNLKENHAWKNTTTVELSGNGVSENALLSKDVLPGNVIQDKEEVSYVAENRNNLVLSVDDLYNSFVNRRELVDGSSGGTTGEAEVPTTISSNLRFERELIPYSIWKDDYKNDKDMAYSSEIELTVKTTISADEDANHMAYDNLGEIVILENTAGRRDVQSIPGSANPRKGEFEVSLEERDASATELVTFTPPTGTFVQEIIKRQSYLVVLGALMIVVVGIVVIKKKVLPKK